MEILHRSVEFRGFNPPPLLALTPLVSQHFCAAGEIWGDLAHSGFNPPLFRNTSKTRGGLNSRNSTDDACTSISAALRPLTPTFISGGGGGGHRTVGKLQKCNERFWKVTHFTPPPYVIPFVKDFQNTKMTSKNNANTSFLTSFFDAYFDFSPNILLLFYIFLTTF